LVEITIRGGESSIYTTSVTRISKYGKKPKNIICQDCGESFVFTVEEQDMFKLLNYQDPKRCKKCRTIHKKYRAYYENTN
jgi:hypothetical protein